MSEPRQDSYDAVVIGSGFGGVSAAALLQRAGLSVLLCEQDEGLGGYGHTFELGAYRFDPAVRVSYSGGPDGLYNAVLSHLGTADQVELVDGRPHVRRPAPRRAPDQVPGLAGGPDRGPRRRCSRSAAKGIESFFQMMLTMHEQGHAMPMNLGLHNLDETAARFPEYFSHLRRTMDDVAREHLGDDVEARSAVNALLALPGRRARPSSSFVAIGQVIMNGAEGTYYSLGGFSSLIDATVAGLRAHGGDVVTGNGAAQDPRRGRPRDRRSRWRAATRCRRKYVVSNADPRQTFLELVGEELLPKPFVRKLGRYTLSHSAFVAFVGDRHGPRRRSTSRTRSSSPPSGTTRRTRPGSPRAARRACGSASRR